MIMMHSKRLPGSRLWSGSGGAVSRNGGASTPEADFSTAVVAGVPQRVSGGRLAVFFSVTTTFYVNNGSKVDLLCYVTANADGTIRPQGGGGSATCRATYENEAEGVRGSSTDGAAPVEVMGARILSLTASTVSIQLPPLAIPLRRIMGNVPADTAMLFPITVNASVPGAQWTTPPRVFPR
jgi:hypothetical protein